MTLLMLNFLPTIIAPKAYKGRAAIKSAFTKYYENHYELTGSTLIRAHLACAQKWGFTPNDIANFENPLSGNNKLSPNIFLATKLHTLLSLPPPPNPN